jgi:hypothetical protein
MPPKKETTGDIGNLIVGFDNKECKLLAAALLSMTSPDKVSLIASQTPITHIILTTASTTGSSLPSSLATPRDRSRRWCVCCITAN